MILDMMQTGAGAWVLAQVIDFPQTFDTNLVMYSALVATVLPGLIAVVVRQGWRSEVKAVAATLVSILAAIPVAYFLGRLDTADYVTSALIIWTLSQVIYRQFWKPSEIAPHIERATG